MTSDNSVNSEPIYNYEYFQQDDVCRICWNRNAFIEITSNSLENTSNSIDIDLAFKITDCLNIMLSPLTRPNKVCHECCIQIKKFYDFKKFCQDTDKKLREIVSNHECSSTDLNIKCEANETEENSAEDSIEDYSNVDENCRIEQNFKTESKWKYRRKRTPTYCNMCMIDCKTPENFESHNFQCHGIENGLYKCYGCEKHFKNRKYRFCHENNFCKGLKDGFKCTICDRFLPKRAVFEGHMRMHRENVPIQLPDDLFNCQKCKKLFKNRESLTQHVESEHRSDKKNYVCETDCLSRDHDCCKAFKTSGTKKHNKSKAKSEKSCGRVFTRRDYLNKHKLTHTGDKQHVCPHCSFRTIQRSSLIVHIRKHTGERPYRCSVCPQRCVSSSNLRAHLQRHLGLKLHECTICNKKFGYKISLQEHMTSHEPAVHACEHCGAAYTRPRALRRHMLGKHGEK